MDLIFDTFETTSLVKADMAVMLFDQIGFNKREAKELVDVFFDLIAQELAQGREVKITGFGNFKVHEKSARPGRNVKTGETVKIKARKKVSFHASSKLKTDLNLPRTSPYKDVVDAEADSNSNAAQDNDARKSAPGDQASKN